MHRDLKPGNLMLSEKVSDKVFSTSEPPGKKGVPFKSALGELQLKIGDFGLSKNAEFPAIAMTKEIMTLWYRAPEVLLDNLFYSEAIDLWSVGVIIFELLTCT